MARVGLALRLRRARRRLLFLGLRRLLESVTFKHVPTLGEWLGRLQFRFSFRERRRIERDLQTLLAGRVERCRVRALLREAYRVNNAAALEIMAMFDRRLEDDEVRRRCEVVGLEHLQAAMSEGRGAILLSPHMGNAAMLPVLLANAGYPVSVVYKEARMMSAGFFQAGLERYGIQGILANAGIRAYGQMLGALKQGGIVFVMIDQGVKLATDGLPQTFLGKRMPMPAGPAQLAKAARAPLLPVVTTAARPLWRIEIQPPVALTRSSLEVDLETLVSITEANVLARPQLWSWHHRRWRNFPLVEAEAA